MNLIRFAMKHHFLQIGFVGTWQGLSKRLEAGLFLFGLKLIHSQVCLKNAIYHFKFLLISFVSLHSCDRLKAFFSSTARIYNVLLIIQVCQAQRLCFSSSETTLRGLNFTLLDELVVVFLNLFVFVSFVVLKKPFEHLQSIQINL